MSGEQWEILPGTWVRMAPKRHEQAGSRQHGSKESSTRDMVKSTVAHPFCRVITKELGEIDRRKGEVSLFILYSAVFCF